MSPQLRKDLGFVADLIAVGAALVALVAWIATWASAVMPIVLTAAGFLTYASLRSSVSVFFVYATTESVLLTSAAAAANVTLWVVFLWCLLRYSPIAEFSLPMLQVLGGASLFGIMCLTVPRAVRAARGRYGQPSA